MTKTSHISRTFCVCHTLYFIFLLGQQAVCGEVYKYVDFSIKQDSGFPEKAVLFCRKAACTLSLGVYRPVQCAQNCEGMRTASGKENMCSSRLFFLEFPSDVLVGPLTKSVVPAWHWTASPAAPKVSQIASPVKVTS